MKDRDTAKVFDRMLGYWMGPRGVEPELKLKVNAVPELADIGFAIDTSDPRRSGSATAATKGQRRFLAITLAISAVLRPV
jgi:hypothetical protein